MLLLRSDGRRNPSLSWSSSIARCTVSYISVFLTQLALCSVPLFFPASSLLFQLAFSAISRFMDLMFNAEVILLIIGLHSIISKDPGYVADDC